MAVVGLLVICLLWLPGAVVRSQGGSYTVKRGDTLWAIAQNYGITVEVLAQANGITDANRIFPGQKLTIPPKVASTPSRTAQTQSTGGTTHFIVRGDTLWDLSRHYGVSVEAILAANPGIVANRLTIGARLAIPPDGRRATTTASRADLQFVWPLRGTITSGFGPRWGSYHHGIDIAAATGTNIVAARSGRVTEAGWKGSYGRTVVIDHGDGVSTLYAHASRLLVNQGQWIRQGEVIAHVGSTGRSTGPHLHFEIRINNNPVNPLRYLR